MNGLIWIRKGVTGVLVLGMALWNAAIPSAWAQLTPEVVHDCQEAINADLTIDPDVREICNTEILPQLEEAATSDDPSPEAEAVEAQVETAAVSIHDATETVKKALENPDAVVSTALTALTDHGVPPTVAVTVEGKLKDALTRASADLSGGATVADVARYISECQTMIRDACGAYVSDFEKVFAVTGGAEGRPDLSREFARLFDPGRDAVQGCFEIHYRDAFQQMEAGIADMDPDKRLRVMNEMTVAGVHPMQVMDRNAYADLTRGWAWDPQAGGMHYVGAEGTTYSGTSVTPFGTGDTGVAPLGIAPGTAGDPTGMANMPEGWAVDQSGNVHFVGTEGTTASHSESSTISTTSDTPRTESSGYSETQAQKYADGHSVCPAAMTHVEGIAEGTGHCI